MLLTKKSRDNRRKELEDAIKEKERKIKNIQKIISEFKTKYLPVRDKCVEIIRSHNLGRYPLYGVFGYEYNDSKLRLVVKDIKEGYWDGEPSFEVGDTLFDEAIQLDIPKSEDDLMDIIMYQCVRKLIDPTSFLTKAVNFVRRIIDEHKVKLDRLNK